MRQKPKKSLGQNFLFDRNILNKIVANPDLSADDTVLEIGAGTGLLTELLAQRVKMVIAVEIDKGLCAELKEKLKDHKNVRIVNADILKFDLKKNLRGVRGPIKVVGNIPYYISSPILERLFSWHDLIAAAYLTVQKEFAGRVAAGAGSRDYGSLSIFTQFYSAPKIIFTISKNCFFPSPKVDSAFMRLEFRQDIPLTGRLQKRFFMITRSAFGKRRKTLRNSLSGVVDKCVLESFFQRYSFSPDIRPERLSVGDFVNLTRLKNN